MRACFKAQDLPYRTRESIQGGTRVLKSWTPSSSNFLPISGILGLNLGHFWPISGVLGLDFGHFWFILEVLVWIWTIFGLFRGFWIWIPEGLGLDLAHFSGIKAQIGPFLGGLGPDLAHLGVVWALIRTRIALF